MYKREIIDLFSELKSYGMEVMMWDANNAPVQGKRFHDYLRIAREFNKKL